MGRDVHSVMLSFQHFLCQPTMVPRTLQYALKDGFREALMARNISQSCQFPSLDTCQKRFLYMHKEIDLALVGLVFQKEDAEKFPQACGFKSLDPFLSQRAGSMSHSHRGGWK